jgi:hypothetical protein
MRRSTVGFGSILFTLVSIPLAVAAINVAGPDPHPSPAVDGSKVLILNGRGTGKNVSYEPGRTKFEVPLYDVATGEAVGRSTHNFICNGPGYCDDIDHYYIGDSHFTARANVSAQPDSQRQGFFLVGTHPVERPFEEGTGIFVGKTGTVRVSGFADTSKMPAEMSLDEIYVITYK